MKTVFTARTVTEAGFVAGLLEAEGIATTLKGENLAGVMGEVPASETWPEVQVEDRDAERAQAIVDAFVGNKASPGETWTCDACGEVHEPQFGECWNCGKARP